MSRKALRCCSCCSWRCWGFATVIAALIPTVVNPLLDKLIAPAPIVTIRAPFVDGDTDVIDYPNLGFIPASMQSSELRFGIAFILMQTAPRWVTSIILALGGGVDPSKSTPWENRNVTLRDARLASLRYEETGFVLHRMDAPSATAVWRGQSDIHKFFAEMEPTVRSLHPKVKRIQWTYNVVRGGSSLGDQPAAVDAPHLDYSQDDAAREEFHAAHPLFPGAIEQEILLGQHDSAENGTFRIMLGVWKPIHRSTPVCDRPLAVMDARDFARAHERPYEVHINFGVATLHNLNAAIVHAPRQRWWYHSFQTTDEVLIFRQYTRGKHMANPHASFENPNCPTGSEPRVSVEVRACLFF